MVALVVEENLCLCTRSRCKERLSCHTQLLEAGYQSRTKRELWLSMSLGGEDRYVDTHFDTRFLTYSVTPAGSMRIPAYIISPRLQIMLQGCCDFTFAIHI